MRQYILIMTFAFLGCKSSQKKNEIQKLDSVKKIEAIDIQSNQDTENINSDYNFDTTLKGGYKISYIKNDTAQYLYLVKGDFRKLISQAESEESLKLLGIKLADYNQCFVLGHPLHILNNENPIPFELFKKETGDTILTGYFIDANESKNVLLYFIANKETFSDSMILFDIVKDKKETFKFPDINLEDARLINRIRIKSVTQNSLTIEFMTDIDDEKHKEQKYSR